MDNPLVDNTDIPSHLAQFVHDNRYLFFVLVSKGLRGGVPGDGNAPRSPHP